MPLMTLYCPKHLQHTHVCTALLFIKIFLQGGGACYTKSSCDQRAKSALGSSTSYKQTVPSITTIMSLSSTDNPDFYQSNMVCVTLLSFP